MSIRRVAVLLATLALGSGACADGGTGAAADARVEALLERVAATNASPAGASVDGEPPFTLEPHFSLSQDPVLGFDCSAPCSGRLTLYAIDSKDARFERSWPVAVGAGG